MAVAQTKTKGNLIVADYTEDLVGFALESFLSVANFPHYRVTVEPFSRGEERWLGADARIVNELTGFKPFYMQFKRPSAYPDFSRSKIIKDRALLNLEISPRVLFFGLRDKNKNHKDYQHNILYKLRRRVRRFANSDAAYVCPLFLERSAYRLHLHIAAQKLNRQFGCVPWCRCPVLINLNSPKTFGLGAPLLAGHVCIPPHDLVTSANHSYSFTEKGTDLCFHSPLSLPEGSMTFAEWFHRLSINLFTGNDLISVENSVQILKELVTDVQENDYIPFPRNLFSYTKGLVAWSVWGRYLREVYSIHQYAFFIWEG